MCVLTINFLKLVKFHKMYVFRFTLKNTFIVYIIHTLLNQMDF
jgi:hypothetical protein